MSAKTERKAVDKVFILLGVAATVALLVAGALAWYGYSFATNMVSTELKAQNIYFPKKDSPALTSLGSEDRVEVERFAGEQLATGEQAKAYANHYIGAHLRDIADGKTYSEVSELARQNPDDAALQSQKNALFQGETLRGILLGTGYAFWTFGMIAKYAALAAFAGAAAMLLLVLAGIRHLRKLK